ncbi:MAG: sensor histidine kinase [Elainellaceae cyanobacterium]
MELERSLQKILLVDDDPNDRLLAVRELKREFPHIQIQEALDWSELNQAFAADEFDLVITDYELNWTTGLDVLHAVKDHDPDRPIVMFTNSGTQEVAVEAMKAGLDDYVIKSPKHLVRLSQAIRSTWENAQVRRKASELEFRLRFLLNELKVGVFRATPDGTLLEASDGLLKLLELNSLSEAQMFFLEKLALSTIDRAHQTQWHREVRLNGSGNGIRWLQISETLVQSNGKTLIDGLIQDITEQQQTAAALQSLNQTLEQRVEERTARLESLNRELEMFAFSVSHDLRSPIRQIDGFTALLTQHLQSITPDETVLHYLQRISELTDRSGRMIDDLLQFSRTGRAKMQYTSVNMTRLVQEVKRQVEPQLVGRTIQWNISPLPTVKGDRNLLRQVWQNLIENAIKYTNPKENATITVGSMDSKGETIFFVRDNGIGFDSNDIEQLFGVFQRLPNAQNFDGTGIGLANVQRVISRHGGRIWAEGNLNEGATFYFSVPDVDSKSV